ncbi:MAG: DUF4959 domain-containing protein [Tannerella sp.]|jgi:hypothetical protein|nr:DUF4959 domain-containing protein [Tannerella sp.]
MKKYLFVFVCSLICFACAEEKPHQPVSAGAGKPPPVTEVKAVSISGGARVSYKIPDTNDLLAIKAVYAMSNGKQREVMVSYYTDTLLLEGLVDTLEHEALLYSVSRTQALSDPVPVSFKPLESSLSKTIRSVRIFADFGGAAFSWKNEDKALLTYDLLAENNQEVMMVSNVFQNRLDSMVYSIRGFEATPRKFAINISDQWGNESGLIYPEGGTLTPLHEEKLDKSAIHFMRLPGDSEFNIWGGMDLFLLDDNLNTFGHSTPEDWPPYLTVDLGKKVNLSRIVIHQRLFENGYYNAANWKVFNVWKCTVETPTTAHVNWAEWEHVIEGKLEKPSGTPIEAGCTNEDIRQAKRGDSFAFPREMEPVRYLRLRGTETWGGFNYSFIAEISFYGSYAQ